jgi:hypothetical protein
MSEARDFLDDFADEGDAQIAPEPKTAETPPEPTQPEAGRDEKGRFKAAADKDEGEGGQPKTPEASEPAKQEAEPGDKPEGEPSPAQTPPPGGQKMVPESAFVGLRKDLQSKIDDLQRQLQERATSAPPKPTAAEPPPPDPDEDPVGYQNHRYSQLEQAMQAHGLNVSEMIARQQVGDEKVDAAIGALKQSQDKAAWQRIMGDRHPYGALLKWHEQHQTLSQIDAAGGLDAFIAAKLAEAQAQQQPVQPQSAAPAQQQPKAPEPPPSLSRGGAGTTIAPSLSEDEDFTAAFKR